jgi:hypothetical protein
MQSRLTLAALAALITCVGVTAAHADPVAMRDNGKFKCPAKAVRYDWMLVATNGDPFYCKLKVNSSNKISGKCFGSGDPDTKVSASGTVEVNNNCEVTGSLKLSMSGDTAKADIAANMTKSQTTIIGALVASSGSDKGKFGTFSAVRMEQ